MVKIKFLLNFINLKIIKPRSDEINSIGQRPMKMLR